MNNDLDVDGMSLPLIQLGYHADRYKMPEPILKAGKKGEFDSHFVADPFVIRHKDGKIWMFYEGYDGHLGRIGCAYSNDGITFTKYDGNPVLDRSPFHSSYPQIFQVGNDYLMHVESGKKGDGALKLYKTSKGKFPIGWVYAGDTIKPGKVGSWDELYVTDGTIFRSGGIWYCIYSGVNRDRQIQLGLAYNTTNNLVYGSWVKAEELNPFPLAKKGFGASKMRMGGSVIGINHDAFIFFYQSRYGKSASIRGRRVGMGLIHVGKPHALTTEVITVFNAGKKGENVPVLQPGANQWDGLDIHHLSLLQVDDCWHGYYDGKSLQDKRWKIGLLRIPIQRK